MSIYSIRPTAGKERRDFISAATLSGRGSEEAFIQWLMDKRAFPSICVDPYIFCINWWYIYLRSEVNRCSGSAYGRSVVIIVIIDS